MRRDLLGVPSWVWASGFTLLGLESKGCAGRVWFHYCVKRQMHMVHQTSWSFILVRTISVSGKAWTLEIQSVETWNGANSSSLTPGSSGQSSWKGGSGRGPEASGGWMLHGRGATVQFGLLWSCRVTECSGIQASHTDNLSYINRMVFSFLTQALTYGSPTSVLNLWTCYIFQ